MAEKVAAPMASEKTLKLLGKIKKDQWKAMGDTVLDMKEFTEAGGMDLLGSLEESLTLKVEELLSPLKNEIMDKVNTVLEPFMPFISTAVNEATTYMTRGMDAITAALTGKFDAWLLEETKTLQKEMDTWGGWVDTLRRQLHNLLGEWNRQVKFFARTWSNFWRSLGWK